MHDSANTDNIPKPIYFNRTSEHDKPELFAARLISDPQPSLFRLGRLAGGGIRRTLDTLPKLCNPC